MKSLNVVTLILVIIGGINWGLVGLIKMDLVATIFSFAPIITTIIYVLVGLSAVYQIMPLTKSMQEQHA
jgi:uncharacterized membrane protein YuzA (DUF378 family)